MRRFCLPRSPVIDTLVLLAALPAALAAAAGDDPAWARPFIVVVTDDATGRGVPLVELRLVNGARFWTDSAGVAAIQEPGLLGLTVFFHVRSHGYEFAADGFGYRGAALKVVAGGRAELRVKRLNVAERLYRVTGGDIYRDSVLAGLPVPLLSPLINAQVFGSDSVLTAVYRGRVYWFWGDTNRPRYPLGNFHVPGATSLLPADGGLDPEVGVDLDYFCGADGFASETARMPGDGPTWLGGLVALAGSDGRERLFAAYIKVRTGTLSAYEHGLVEFRNEALRFEKAAVFPEGAPAYPGGHTFRHRSSGGDHIYFANPYPHLRVAADPEALKRPEAYEAFTPFLPDSGSAGETIARDGSGAIAYAWRRGAPPLTAELRKKLEEKGRLKPEESILQLRDVETGAPVTTGAGSVAWNDHRRRWVMIACQVFGLSVLGEIWYAEGDTPLGPWVYARKVMTHDRYSFYNPRHHPFFDKEGGRMIFFEGTYTTTFSGNDDATPRYDYNQVMYKLDLANPRLGLAAKER